MIINIILFILYFVFKSIADKISFHFRSSIFSKLPTKYHNFLNPSESWRNKWKNGDKIDGEKFIGSSTIFVMFTDLWHLINFFQYIIIASLVVLNTQPILHPILDIGIYLIIGLSIFELLFSYIFKKRTK